MIVGLFPVAAFADGGDGTTATIYEAKVGETEYATLEEAVKEVASATEKTITLINDVTLESQVTLPEGVTLNGGSHKITAVAPETKKWSSVDGSKYMILANAANTVINDVTMDANHNAYGCIQFYATTDGKVEDVTLKNAQNLGLMVNASQVTATGKITLDGNGWGDVINVGWGKNISGVTPCSFDVSEANLVGVDSIYADAGDVERANNAIPPSGDGKTSITIKTPDGLVPVSSGDEGIAFAPADSPVIVATVTGADGQTEYYSNLQAAVAGATSGDTITVAAGTQELKANESIVLDKKLTIQGVGKETVIKGSATTDYGNGLFTFNSGSEGSVLKNLTVEYTSSAAQRAAVYFNYGFTGNQDNVTKIQNVAFTSGKNDTDRGNEKAIAISSTYIDGGYVEISGCSINNFAYGMYFNGIHNLTIENNTIDGTKYNAINIAGDNPDYDCKDIVIKDNVMTDISYGNYEDDGTYSSGINFGSAVNNVNMENNDITMLNGKAPMHVVTKEGESVSKVVVTYMVNDDEYVVIIADVTDGKATFTEPVDPVGTNGYKFTGWNYPDSVIVAGNTVTLTVGDESEYTFTAQWQPPYTGKYSYEIFTKVGENGTISVDRYATEGDDVTITVSPDEAYLLDELTVTANGKEVEVKDNGDGTYTFKMPSADAKIVVTFAEDSDWEPEPEEPAMPFTDVNEGDWFYDVVLYAYDNGLMTGVSATEFAPNQTTTRGMIVSMLARLEGVTSAESAGFTDVADSDWYATAVNWAASVGVVNGYEDNTFRPNAPITREQMAAILYNYADYKGYDVSARADLSDYADAASISSWAEDVLAWANAEGLINGMTATTIDPQGATTRAQTAAMFERFLTAHEA